MSVIVSFIHDTNMNRKMCARPRASSRGQHILPFHCSIVCSLSSSCLSDICGGGCTSKENHKSVKSELLHRWGNPPLQERLPHRVGLCRIVPHVDVRVVEGVFHRDAAFWIDDQHFGQQVPCLTCCCCNRERAVWLRENAQSPTSF